MRGQPASPPVRRSPAEAGDSPPAILRREAIHRRSLAAADMIALGCSLAVVLAIEGGGLRPAALLAVPFMVLVNKLLGLYDRDELVVCKTTLDEAPALLNAASLYALILYLLHDGLFDGPSERAAVAVSWMVFAVGATLARVAVRAVAAHLASPERIALIGDAWVRERLGSKLDNGHAGAELVGHLEFSSVSAKPFEGASQSGQIAAALTDMNAHRVIVAPGRADTDEMLEVIGAVKECGLRVSVLPRLFEVVGSSVEFDRLDGITLLGVHRFGLSRSSRLIKRTLDVVVSATGLVVGSPLLLALAAAVKLDSSGPALFRQTRVGQEGRRFTMLKFRTMVCDADELKSELAGLNEAEGLFKIAEDPRQTRIGRLLRRTSLDELPQLWNVLAGDMSLVGPRPLIEDEDRRIEGRHRRRLRLKPGMTGQWQVLGSARIPLPEMLTIDYLYAGNWSLWADLKILLRTVPHMLSRRGR